MKILEEFKSRFNQLTDREQKLVSVATISVVIALVYFAIYAPLQDSIVQGEKSLNSQKELLSWVSQNANRAIQLRQSGNQGAGYQGSLPQAVNQTAGRANISIARMQPQGDDIQVWVDNAPFDSVLTWLDSLEKMGISIIEADIAEGDGAGSIKIRRLRLSKL